MPGAVVCVAGSTSSGSLVRIASLVSVLSPDGGVDTSPVVGFSMLGKGVSRPSAIEKDRSLRGIDLVNLWFPLEIFLMNQTVGAAKVNLNVFYLSIIFHVNIFPG